MARIDQLNLNPDSEKRKRTPDEQRLADDFLDLCTELLDNDRYSFAADTVTSMRDRIRDSTDLPTQAMFRALDNIRHGGNRQADSLRNWNRRYDGFGR